MSIPKVIKVNIKRSDETGNPCWTSEKLLFYDSERYEQALKLIEEVLGFRASYVVYNASSHPLSEEDYKYAIPYITLRKLRELADEVVEEYL